MRKHTHAWLALKALDAWSRGNRTSVGRDRAPRLPPAGARLLLLAGQRIGRLEVEARQAKARWAGQSGRELRIQATLRDQRGKPFPGLVPALLTIQRPDGTRDDFSRATVFADGQLALRIPLPRNLDPGPWTVQIQERAAGTTTQTVVEP